MLPKVFARRFSSAAGLRNILVHDYVDVDLPLIFRQRRGLKDFDTFARRVARYLERRR